MGKIKTKDCKCVWKTCRSEKSPRAEAIRIEPAGNAQKKTTPAPDIFRRRAFMN